ncbi:DNA polymerase Y family protein [Acetobacter sp. TBRC 12305]|uniref:DNA polymerase Y family protein n=1 Tax=Acetobacter garciniae TaxID=2817435 RepID=A0A939HLM3_9PROT|nr:DNA polymerase Y family protein [Acetobacter garciniae]MBO1324306.1 DNA polymerase Y family protein [Acetobacter garciniae]MBX0343995.1 DNA polymerase Y family protein [Acetobacter garciniae]
MPREDLHRVVSLYLPLWPTDRIRKKLGKDAPGPDTPLALVGREGSRRVVLSLDLAARRLGLRPGTPVAKAQALYPDLVLMDADPQGDRQGLEKLALWFQQRISPIVAVDAPDGLVLDTTGADHLHGGEMAMLKDMLHRLAGVGIRARAVVADTWGAAHGLARYGRAPIAVVPAGQTVRALAELPVEALRLSASIVEGLATLGVSRIGALAAMPRAPLVLRFGPDVAQRLDQALGRVGEAIIPVRPLEPVEVARSFAEPIAAAQTIARYIGKLVPPLCQALDTRAEGVRRLDLLLHRVDSRIQAIRVVTAMPVRDIKRLTRLLCEKIETIDPGFGIERMVLIAALTEPMERRQRVSSLIAEEEADVSDLIDTLANRVGTQALYRFTPVESDLPERSFCRVPALAPEGTKDWPEHWPRPTRLLARPEAVQAMAELPDQPPLFFIWRGVRRKVKCADGPERVFGEWWKNDAELTIARDYFRVEDTHGERFWLYRAGDGEHGETGSQGWFIHGIFG